MQSKSVNCQSLETDESSDKYLVVASLVETNYPVVEESLQTKIEPIQFSTRWVSYMEMYANAQTVAEYLDAHNTWFRQCAHPMSVDAIGPNAYALTIGRFGAFGYEVEPKVGLDLLPQDQGAYRIKTVPVPGYIPPGYDVDFQATMHLVEVPMDAELAKSTAGSSPLPEVMTRVEWQLDLLVTIHFPRFIYALPKTLIQNTGDSLLRQIVRQVSRRLTAKVQEDFHQAKSLPVPKAPQKKWFQREA